MFGRNIFFCRPSANKNSSVDLLKLATMGNFGLFVTLGLRLFIFPKLSRNLSEESRITPKLPVNANFERSAEEFLLAERKRMKIFQPNRYVNASYE